MEKWERDLIMHNRLSDAFNHTRRMSRENALLSLSVQNSIAGQRIITEDEPFRCASATHGTKEGQVIVSRKRTFEAADAYKGKRIAVLNFGSAVQPGGNGHKKTLTQEECLCRESTLYSCINNIKCKHDFYDPHTELDNWYNADMIYTPAVTVFKTCAKVPVLRQEKDWFITDVITMAAPNLEGLTKDGRNSYDNELMDVFEFRFTRIMRAAAERNVDVLILGAFGCGAFGNDPIIVAMGAGRALEKYRHEFDTVEFAVYETGRKTNYRIFRIILDRYTSNNQ